MTPRDVDQILNELGKVSTQLARLEERLGAHDSHETRISALERSNAVLRAFVVFLTIITPVSATVLLATQR